MEDKQSLITMGLKPMLLDEQISVRVKMSICGESFTIFKYTINYLCFSIMRGTCRSRLDVIFLEFIPNLVLKCFVDKHTNY